MSDFDVELEAIKWARKCIGLDDGYFGLCKAIYVQNDSNEFVAVVILSNFTSRNVDLHVAAEKGFWCRTHDVLKLFNKVFELIFTFLGAARVTGLIKSRNMIASRFVEKLGFKFEGKMRGVFEDDDLCIYGMLKEEYMIHSWRQGQ